MPSRMRRIRVIVASPTVSIACCALCGLGPAAAQADVPVLRYTARIPGVPYVNFALVRHWRPRAKCPISPINAGIPARRVHVVGRHGLPRQGKDPDRVSGRGKPGELGQRSTGIDHMGPGDGSNVAGDWVPARGWFRQRHLRQHSRTDRRRNGQWLLRPQSDPAPHREPAGTGRHPSYHWLTPARGLAATRRAAPVPAR
jgi:hypothetical protein